MTEIKFQKDKQGNVEQVILKGVSMYYCNVRRPRPIYDDRNVPYDKARKEYSVEVAVTEEVADEYDQVFTKQGSKKMTNKAFKEKFKLESDDELPFPDQKKQYTLKITQKAQKKDGSALPDGLVPRVFIVEDGKAKDISSSTNVGNGSVGDILIRARSVPSYGTFAYLSKIKVNDLVEYQDQGPISNDDKEFLGVDEVELDEDHHSQSVSNDSSGGDSSEGSEEPEEELDDDDF